MQIKKHFVVIFMMVLSLFVLAACSDKSDNESKPDKKEEYQSKFDLPGIYQSEEELTIAKDLIGSYYKEIEGKKLDGSSYQLSKNIKDKFVVLKINNLDCVKCTEDYQEFNKFMNAREEILILDIFPNVKDKKEFETYYEQTGSNEQTNNNLIYTDSTDVIDDYKAKYPPMYIYIDKEGYVAFVLFGTQSFSDLMETLNQSFDTEYSIGEGQLTEQELEYIQEGQKSLIDSVENGDYQKAEDYNQKLLEEALKSNK